MLALRLSATWRQSNLLYAIFGYKEKKEMKECIRIMHKFTNEIIAKRRKYLLNQMKPNERIQGNEKDGGDNDVGMTKKMVFLDIFLQSTIDGRPLTNDEILEETETILLAVTNSIPDHQTPHKCITFCFCVPTGPRFDNDSNVIGFVFPFASQTHPRQIGQ